MTRESFNKLLDAVKPPEKKMWALACNRNESRVLYDTYDNLHDRSKFPWTILSAPFDTKEELFQHEGILEKPCKICGSPVSTNYMDDVKAKLTSNNVCFYCYFWMSKVDMKNNPRVARIGGTHYYIDDDNPSPHAFKGFGGSTFRIKFDDGRMVITSNLWCQGDIPSKFKDMLPDNAVFIKDNPDKDPFKDLFETIGNLIKPETK